MFEGLLPDNFIASTTEVIVDLFGALDTLIYLIAGILLAAVVLSILIGALKK